MGDGTLEVQKVGVQVSPSITPMGPKDGPTLLFILQVFLFLLRHIITVQVRFDNNPVSIEATDRIGVYSPSTNASLKLAVPYEFDRPTSTAMYFSRQQFDAASAFTTGLVIYMEDLRWPRSLTTFLSFCQSISGEKSIRIVQNPDDI